MDQTEKLEIMLKEIDKQITHEKNNLIKLLQTEEIENINLYQIYLNIKDLLTNRKIISNRLIMDMIDN